MTYNFGQRLRKYRKQKSYTIESFAHRAGMTKDHVGKIERGIHTNPTQETIEALAKALDISPFELQYGKVYSEKSERGFEDLKAIALDVVLRPIPVIGAASCGKWKDPSDMQYAHNHADEYINLPSKDPDAFVVIARGDSMIGGKIESGDYLLIEPNSQILNGKPVLAFDPNNGCMVKLFFRKDNGDVTLVSQNEKYPPIDVKPDDGFRCYKVARIVKTP